MVVELKRLREEISEVEGKLIKILKKRFEIVKEIGECKLKNGLLVHDKKREQEIIEIICKKSRFSKDFVKKLFNLLFIESKRLQRDVK